MRRNFSITDPFLDMDFFAKEFGKDAQYLRNIAWAQRTGAVAKSGKRKGKAKFSQQLLASYPQFILGPGGSPGLYASQYRAWREEQNAPIGRTA